MLFTFVVLLAMLLFHDDKIQVKFGTFMLQQNISKS
jgi:hypothetical protein